MSIVTLKLSADDDDFNGKKSWTVTINGLVYSQRRTIASQNPEFILNEETGELFCKGLAALTTASKEVPIRVVTTYLNLLANLKYKLVSCSNLEYAYPDSSIPAVHIIWTLQA